MSDAPVDGQDPEAEGRPPSPEAAEPAERAETTPPARAKGTFDVFADQSTPLPFSEAPDLEEELEAEQEPDASAEAATTVLEGVAADPEPAEPDEDGDQDPAEAQTEVVEPVELERGPAADLDEEDEDGPIEPAPPATEVEETTLIPKVTDTRPAESTTVMPPVSAPTSGMAHRPYTSAPSGYGARSTRSGWGSPLDPPPQGPVVTPAGGLPDADPTQVQPAVPGEDPYPTQVQPAVLAPAANPNGRGYRPPEFHQVDTNRSELPPPQNFRLDRRELDAEADAEGGRKFGRRAALIGGGAVVVAAAALTVTGVVKLPGTSAPTVPTVGYSPAAESGASDATQTGTAFLQAWQNGEFEAAANITDNPAEALAAFKWYKENLGVVGLTINPDAANGVGWMTFSVATQAGTPMGQWNYQSGFAAYSKQIGSYTRWFVKWSPEILYASLKAGYQLKILKTPASVKGLVDRNGAAIVASEHPSLANTISILVSKAKVTGATDGQQIIMVDEKGAQVATVTTLTNPIDNGTVATTLDMKVQAAAEAAVQFHSQSSMVAIEPSTGHILAIANNTTSQYYDDALLAGVAPGSTFKIITSTALLGAGMVTLDENAPCPAVLDVDTTLLHNSELESGVNNTYEYDFAQSCNNAFSNFYNHAGMTENLLADTASKYYGLNQQWDIGVGESAQYMNVPKGLSGAGLAESLVGQDNVTSCPLAMCSVAATVANGSFMQPILIPKYKQITATPLPSPLHSELKTLMASVITEGTGEGLFPKNGHYFGKTGTAEVGAGASLYNNSWFVVFNDAHDLSLCALSIRGSYGATTAGPECAQVFKKLFPADF
jgi:Penicillin binding protein transpeptidase domain